MDPDEPESKTNMRTTVDILSSDSHDLRIWDDFVFRSNCSYPYMLSAFREIIRETFHHEPLYLVARRGGEVCGLLPIFFLRSWLFGRLFATLPFFPHAHLLSEDPETEHALLARAVEEARTRKVRFWILRQGDPCGTLGADARQGFHAREEKIGVLLTLPHSETQLWEGFRSKLRSQIRKAEKNGLVCREGRIEDLPAFYQVFSTNMRDLGTPVYPPNFFSSILAHWEESSVFTVWKDRIPVGGAILIGWRGRVEVPWASTLRKYNPLAPNMILYYSMLKRSIVNGYKTFDFGRSTPGEGTHNFKLQWGGEEKPLPWLYWTSGHSEAPVLNRRNRKFTFLSEAWKRIPLPVAEFLGPSIIRNIP